MSLVGGVEKWQSREPDSSLSWKQTEAMTANSASSSSHDPPAILSIPRTADLQEAHHYDHVDRVAHSLNLQHTVLELDAPLPIDLLEGTVLAGECPDVNATLTVASAEQDTIRALLTQETAEPDHGVSAVDAEVLTKDEKLEEAIRQDVYGLIEADADAVESKPLEEAEQAEVEVSAIDTDADATSTVDFGEETEDGDDSEENPKGEYIGDENMSVEGDQYVGGEAKQSFIQNLSITQLNVILNQANATAILESESEADFDVDSDIDMSAKAIVVDDPCPEKAEWNPRKVVRANDWVDANEIIREICDKQETFKPTSVLASPSPKADAFATPGSEHRALS